MQPISREHQRSSDLICFSHLRWDFVYQRPQHLLSRCSRQHRVFYWEEPIFDATGESTVELLERGERILVVRPHLPAGSNADVEQQRLLARFIADFHIESPILWYYTPMALSFSSHIRHSAIVYDCMDELSAFLGAPRELIQREQHLFDHADVVFTGGISLYEAKRQQHPNVHPFPSSIDVAHFGRGASEDPADQKSIPRPRAGFFGVLDERFDHQLLGEVASLRPETQFILLGPVVKIDAATLPKAGNIHYLGQKSYNELPSYLAGWDVALIPFAQNESTRFISPTKTPEYLAAGKPVISTPITDVIRGYGKEGLVSIASAPAEFAAAIDQALQPASEDWKTRVAQKLSATSWDKTWAGMWHEIEKVMRSSSPQPSLASSDVTRPKAPSAVTEKYDYLVVGAGFAGGVLAERLASTMGKRVLLIDKRDHIGGNTYDYRDAAGLLVHKYGPHIFHTNNAEVVTYLSQFTEWRDYEHRVLASVDGKLLPIPINLDTINQLYSLSLDAAGMEAFLNERTIQKDRILTSEDIVVSRVGRELYEKFFRNYTRKQWGLDPSQLDASVAGRIPVRFDRDDRYFADRFQAMPKHGYTALFERMLDHPNIDVRVGVDYRDVMKKFAGTKIIFTGPVDEFFGYRFGPLPYRSLEFRHQTFDVERFQPTGVVNYPNDHAYTRVTEFKYLTGDINPRTSVVYEYPQAEGDPYYPIPRPENAAIYARYKDLADRSSDVQFVGRLANYRYYNMDQVVAQALLLARKIAGGRNRLLVASPPEASEVRIGTPLSTVA